jgi:hypothetical protein
MKTPQVPPMAGMSVLGFREPPKATNEKTIAERKWQAPLKPSKPQYACDEGLFGDEMDQVEMFMSEG